MNVVKLVCGVVLLVGGLIAWHAGIAAPHPTTAAFGVYVLTDVYLGMME